MLEFEAEHAGRGVKAAFSVPTGGHLAIMGENGAGKSTILALMAGVLAPTSGRISVHGRVLAERGSRSMWVPPHDRRVALLAQESLLFPHMSVVENVAFGPRCAGVRPRAAHGRALQYLERVGMADFAARRPATLSGGQAQRIAIARALAAEPKLLLLDEPFAALDVDATPALRHLLAKVLADTMVVLVTHDAVDALVLSDAVVILENGNVAESGPTASVLGSPRSSFAARLADLNIVEGTLSGDAVVADGGLRIAGAPTAQGEESGPGVAVFAPSAVSVFGEQPTGSPRNVFRASVVSLEPRGGVIRMRAGRFGADVTPAAVAELRLSPGVEVYLAVKATQVRLLRR